MMAEIDIVKILKALLRFWWLIVAIAIIFASSAYILTQTFVEPQYTASATMYVWSDNKGSQGTTTDGSTSYSQLVSSRSLAETYIYVLQSSAVADAIIENLGLNCTASALQGMMSFSTVDETEIIRVSVTSTSPEEAKDIANAAVDIGGAKIIDIVKAGSVSAVDYAKTPTYPSAPNTIRAAAIAGIAGALIVAAIIALVDYFDIKIKTVDDIMTLVGENEDEIPLIAVIPRLDMDTASYGKYYKYSYYKNYGYGYGYGYGHGYGRNYADSYDYSSEKK